MRITADTNVLIRILTEDHPQQTEQAKAALATAETVVIPTLALCEAVWVLRSRYSLSGLEIARIVRSVIANSKMLVDHAAIQAGLVVLDGGGDFADGVIAYEGQRLGSEMFVSFDQRAVRLLAMVGVPAQTPG